MLQLNLTNKLNRLIDFLRKFPVLKKFPVNFYKFVIVGGTVFVIDFIVFSILFHILKVQFKLTLWQISEQIALVFSLPNIISVSLASVFGYYFNKTWSFENASDHVASQFSKYLGVAIFNNLINNVIFGFLLYSFLAPLSLSPFISTSVSKVLATSFQVVSSYLLYKYVVFKEETEVISEAVTP